MTRKRANNEGSHYFHKTRNRGCAQVSLDGKRLTKYAKTQKEYRDWVRATLVKIDNGVGRVDTASVVAVYLVQVAAVGAAFLMTTGAMAPLPDLLWWSVRQLVVAVLQVLYGRHRRLRAALAGRAGYLQPGGALLGSLCEPLLRPVRRLLPPIGGLDFSPLVVILGLQALKILVL